MYRIIKDGAGIGLTENPNYIKQAENGCYVLCPERDASGIAFDGTVYHLLGREGMTDVETVMLEAVDAGSQLKATQEDQEDADALNVDHEYRITLLELGFTSDDMT
jgi:hypothetical protein